MTQKEQRILIRIFKEIDLFSTFRDDVREYVRMNSDINENDFMSLFSIEGVYAWTKRKNWLNDDLPTIRKKLNI